MRAGRTESSSFMRPFAVLDPSQQTDRFGPLGITSGPILYASYRVGEGKGVIDAPRRPHRLLEALYLHQAHNMPLEHSP
jgi:hypothetical protein